MRPSAGAIALVIPLSLRPPVALTMPPPPQGQARRPSRCGDTRLDAHTADTAVDVVLRLTSARSPWAPSPCIAIFRDSTDPTWRIATVAKPRLTTR